MSELETIAMVIGTHFWKVKSDKEAIEMGMDCARQVFRAIRSESLAEEILRKEKRSCK